MAELLEIVNLKDGFEGHWASLDHFDLVGGSEIGSDIVIREDHITPYCVDHTSRRLVFADLPPGSDLTPAAFAFEEQKRLARRLIAVPYEELPGLASRVASPAQLIFIFNASRSGTTLMNQILNQVDGVVSFAELDFFTNVYWLGQQGVGRDELVSLLSWCVRLFAYPYADDMVGFKFRHNVVDVADLFHTAFPSAKHLFMYRNALDWSASWRRFDLEWGSKDEVGVDEVRQEWLWVTERTRTEYVDRLASGNATLPGIVGRLLQWVDSIEGCLRARECGVPLFTFRYEDLDAHREEMLGLIFEYLELGPDHVPQGMRAFERDSQEGTGLERKDGKANQLTLDDAQVQAIRDALGKHPRRLTPDVLLPGTVVPSEGT